jgi:hypothetical protein
MFDRVHDFGSLNVVSTTASNSTGPNSASFTFTANMNRRFIGPSSAGILGIEEGSIYFMAVSSLADALATAVIQVYSRVLYLDA